MFTNQDNGSICNMITQRIMYKVPNESATQVAPPTIPSMICKHLRIGVKNKLYSSTCCFLNGQFKIIAGKNNFCNMSAINGVHPYSATDNALFMESNVLLEDKETESHMKNICCETMHNLISAPLDAVGYLYMNERYNLLNDLVNGKVYPLEYPIYEALVTKEMHKAFSNELGLEFMLRSVQLFDNALIQFCKDNKDNLVDKNGNLKTFDEFVETLDKNRYKLPTNVKSLKQVLMGSMSSNFQNKFSLSVLISLCTNSFCSFIWNVL